MNEKDIDNNLKKVIAFLERKQLKKQLQDIEDDIPKSIKKSKVNWLLVASIALIFSLGGYFFFLNSTPTNEELFAEYFSPYENIVAPIVRNQKEKTSKEIAFALYENGNYDKAIENFETLKNDTIVDASTLNFYSANAYLQLEKVEKAKTFFLKVLKSKNKEWEQETLWYLGLINIKQNDLVSAKNNLHQLQKIYPNYKKKDVTELLKNID